MAVRRSKKSQMIFVRASESTLMGMKVLKASRARSESARGFGWLVRQVPKGEGATRTLLANLEQLVRFPGDYTSRKSAPTPLDHAAEHLFRQLAHLVFRGGREYSHHRLRQPQLLRERIARERGAFLHGIEEVSDEAARGAGVGAGTKREQEKGDVES